MAENRTTFAPEHEAPNRDGAQEDQEHREPAEKEKSADQSSEEEKQRKPHPWRKQLVIGGAIVAAIIAVVWWLHSRKFEDTDDAQVDAHTSGIAARIAGTVIAVYADQNQFVKAGEVLVDLDPRDYQVAVDQARSEVAQAQAETVAEQPNVPVTQVTSQTSIATASSDVVAAQAAVTAAERDYDAALAKVREAEANNIKAQADVERYRPLAEKDEVPREQYDQVVATARSQAATVASNQASAEAAAKAIEQRRADLDAAQKRAEQARQTALPQVQIREANVQARRSASGAARAQLEQALLNLSYCKIVTPVDGIVAKRMAEAGDRLAPGQQVFLITQIDDIWVTANFRETQLRRMHPGQFTRIHVDALGQDFDGYVESMPAATGAVTSLLPPENATGNFVKVVQRLPVRIRFKSGQSGLEALRPGMSVEPKVTVE